MKFFPAFVGLLMCPAMCYAGGGFSSDAMQAQVSGASRTGLFEGVLPRQELYRLSSFSMLSIPPREGRRGPDSGYSLRNVLSLSFRLNERLTLGPSFEFTEKFSAPTPDLFVLGDPALKLGVSGLPMGEILGNPVGSILAFSAQAPVSQISRSLHIKTAASATWVPRMRIGGTRLSFQGIASLRATMAEKSDQSGNLYSGRLFTGIQGNYRLTSVTSTFLMGHFNHAIGPEMPLGDVSSQAFLKQMLGMRPFGIMSGALFRVGHSISVSPRLNWFVGESVKAMTLGVNASLQLI